MAEKTYTDKQLLALESTDGLNLDQLQRRIVLIELATKERTLDVAADQARKHQEEKAEALKRSQAKLNDIKAQQAEDARIRTMCKHKTGGKDRKGFHNGDGEAYGHSVSREQLPTGEVYGICFRCQREWHDPSWCLWRASGEVIYNAKQAVIRGEVSLKEYKQAERDYAEMMSWTCKSFSTDTGELPGGHMFRIPLLEQQRQKDALEFQAHLATLPQHVLIDAGVLV